MMRTRAQAALRSWELAWLVAAGTVGIAAAQLFAYWSMPPVWWTIVAATQWPVLRRRIARAWLWIPATTVSAFVGWYVGFLVGLVVTPHLSKLFLESPAFDTDPVSTMRTLTVLTDVAGFGLF